jgi:adenine-specific DNA-methyltransferase
MAQRPRPDAKRPIESYEHRDRERLNNPPAGLVTPETDPDAGQRKQRYAYDPHLDPQLQWAGKAEHVSFEVPTVSLHVHERIDPRTIIEAVRRVNSGQGIVNSGQLSLFEEERKEPLRDAIEFYQHKHGWSNRLIAGDSLLVMNSLLEKEGMAGKVQMIYLDPPYGIRYGSNFQPFVNKRDVKDGKDEDLTAEPEQIRAFRDTWELGIHSYLTYLRDRLLLARELLTESGSIFVQISDENVHHVRELMDEVFGADCAVATVVVKKKGSQKSELLDPVNDFILWYSKTSRSHNAKAIKFHKLYLHRALESNDLDGFVAVEFSNGQQFPLSELSDPEGRQVNYIENIDRFFEDYPDAKLVRPDPLTSGGERTNQSLPFEFGSKVFSPPAGACWKTTVRTQDGSTPGMKRLAFANRLIAKGTLYFKRYHDDFDYKPLQNWWDNLGGASNPIYVVQTNPEIIKRCLLMTTDPGDLVFDPTCGSGTTAYVAEQWGRRWITCDTSRVAITLARQRLMTAVFDYYELAHPEEGVGSGFKYKTVPHVTLKSIANNPEIDGIYARLHPAVEKALAELNAALKRPSPAGRGAGGEGYPRFKVTTGGRAGQFVDFAVPDGQTFTMPSGQVVPANQLVEWEVPYDFPADWPRQARAPFEAFHAARRALQKEIDDAIARHAPQETLYDQPDKKKARVSGPFTVEAVPAPAVKSVDSVLGIVDSRQSADTAQAIHSSLSTIHYADSSVARSGETLRQGEWRDELLRAGIRGKAGQHMRFARLEPQPGCRWLHADGEVVDSEQGIVNSEEKAGRERKLSTPHYSLSTNRVAVSFGPEHAPLEQRQVQRAWEEARTLVPQPKLLIFAAFQFDPEAAKDIDEMKPELAGMQFLKVQMNADLLTDDLKKKRAGNESFWLIGQPDVVVVSEEWIVNSRNEALAAYDVVAKLSGVDRLAEINGLGRDDLSLFIAIAQRRDLWDAFATDTSSGIDSGKHRRGAGASEHRRVSSVSGHRAGIPGRIGDAADFVRELESLAPGERQQRLERLRRNREVADRAREIAASLTFPLSTIHYAQVTIHGFDYYNTKTGGIESGGEDKIAVWLIDTDYDGRSLYPRQVFFPMAGENEGWARLAKNLKAEIDEQLIEAYRGTVSLPFEPGEHKRIAVKIVDDRGIESLKVMEVE